MANKKKPAAVQPLISKKKNVKTFPFPRAGDAYHVRYNCYVLPGQTVLKPIVHGMRDLPHYGDPLWMSLPINSVLVCISSDKRVKTNAQVHTFLTQDGTTVLVPFLTFRDSLCNRTELMETVQIADD